MALTKISTGGVKDDTADEAKLKVSNAGTNGQFLSKQSGNTGGLTWATVDSTPEGTVIKSTGESNAGYFLRTDGDGTCSWTQDASVLTNITPANISAGELNASVVATGIKANTVDEEDLKISNAGTNGQYLQKQSGNTGGLTWADVVSGASITATASGAVAANKAVHLDSSGNVKVPVLGGPSMPSSAPVDIDSSITSTSFPTVAWHEDQKRVVVAFSMSDVMYCIAGELSSDSTSISWGSKTIVTDDNNMSSFDMCYEPASKKIVIIWRNSSSDLRGCIVTVNDKTITYSQQDKVNPNNHTFNGRPRIVAGHTGYVGYNCKRSNNDLVGGHWKVSNGGVDNATVVTVATGTQNNSNYNPCIAYSPDQSRYINFYVKSSTTYHRNFNNGTSISQDGENSIVSSGLSHLGATYDTDKNRVVFAYDDGSNSKIRAGSVSSGSITWGSDLTFSTSTMEDWNPDLCYDSDRKIIFCAYDRADYNRIMWNDFALGGSSNTTVTTPDSGQLDNSTAGVMPSCCFVSTGDGIISVWGRNTGLVTVKIRTGSTTTVTDSNFVGFSDGTAYTNGQTVTVNVVGNTTTQSGLTPGTKYYVQKDGSLGTSTMTGVLAGKALTATSLLIAG